MTVKMTIQKIDGRMCYGIMVQDRGKTIDLYPGSLEKTIKTYEN